MSLDQFRTLGRSGLRVSPICLGTLTFGEENGYGATPEASAQVLDHYLAAGGNFVDTANIYSFGHAEAIIGEAIGGSSQRRDRLVIATKFSSSTCVGDPNSGGASRKSIISACEQSLRRLRTDYIDLYWQHYEDPFTPVDETMRALDDLVQSGKVRYVGISDTHAWRIVQQQMTAQLHGWAPFVGLQIEYSLAERGMEFEHLAMAREMGLGITPFALLADGVLTGKYRKREADPHKVQGGDVRAELAGFRLKDRTIRIVEALAVVAERHNATSAQVAVAWVVHRPGVTAGIVGARTVAQLSDNLAALDIKLTETDIAELDAVSRPRRSFVDAMTAITLPVAFPDIRLDGKTIPANRFSPPRDARFY